MDNNEFQVPVMNEKGNKLPHYGLRATIEDKYFLCSEANSILV